MCCKTLIENNMYLLPRIGTSVFANSHHQNQLLIGLSNWMQKSEETKWNSNIFRFFFRNTPSVKIRHLLASIVRERKSIGNFQPLKNENVLNLRPFKA